MNPEIIIVEDLVKNYKGIQALKDISFNVFKGEIFGILGPNGAGKTTTLEIMEGLRKQTSGRCSILGYDNLKEPNEIKKRIGVQLQNSEYFNFLNLTELLNLFASLYHKKTDPLEILNKVGLENKAKNTVKELSGGQKQRFKIASALIHDPEILFLDEPTTALDPQARHDMWHLIKNLNKTGKTIILTTHYMEEAEFLCHRLAILDKGQILKLDSPQKLIEEASKTYKLSFFTENRELKENFFKEFEPLKVLIEYPKAIIELKNMDALPSIINKLRAEKITYSFLNIKSATLEDVYLRLTGKEYNEN